ncbi:MAG: RhuM family protein, partial [bacterium]|nr:RhuM family protein [bacterium]
MAKKKKNEITIRSSAAEYLTFVSSTGGSNDSIEVRYEDENIWITQKMMATLYGVETHTINYHIRKIFSDSEMQEGLVIRNFRITAADGKTYDTKHYALQMIIAMGFKVNSDRAVQFRKWVNQIAKDYTIKGWVIDSERMKNGGSPLTEKYYEELLEQIREIRLSERRFYQKITDIYSTSLDYDKDAKTTKEFFAKVQNKLHYATHKQTAAEVIYKRANADKEHMGLT